jgi:hypothetical protein
MIDLKSESMARTMLQLQDEINSKINSNWRMAANPWYRAIWTECAELTDHIGWKWWKKQLPNIPQIQLELIDIWHFGLSDILEKAPSYEAAIEALEPALQVFLQPSLVEPSRTFCMQLTDVETFAETTLSTRRFDSLLFAKLAICSGLSLETIFIQYVGKNVLNLFRQDNGYNDGTYIKIWDGREDNEWLVDIAKLFNPAVHTFATDLYKALADQYSKARLKE